MSEPITITATVAAWLPPYSKPHELLAEVRDGNAQRAVSLLTLYGAPDRHKFSEGYVRVGEAHVTVTLISEDEQVSLAVKGLRDQLEADRQKWLQRQQQILDAIQSLQALSYTPEVVEA